MKKIYVNYYAPTLHSMYNEMLKNPPEGFEYVLKSDLDNDLTQNVVSKVYSINKNEKFWNFNKKILSKLINTVKIKDFLYSYFVIPKSGIDLIYSTGYIIKKKIPWIIDIEVLHVLNGYRLNDLERNKNYYKKILEGKYCKHITVWNSNIYNSLNDFFKSDIIKEKTSIIRHTIKSNNFVRDFGKTKDNINFLFLGSGNILTASYVRGIKDSLLIYKELLKKHKNITLTIAPFLPDELKEEFSGLEGLIIKNKVLNKEEMSELYKETDILLHPSYSNPAMTLLEAMNFGISILTTNYGGVDDLVKDGYNGIICKNNSLFDYYQDYYMSISNLEEKVMEYSGKDQKMINDFVDKASILIEDEELRKKLALNAKKTLTEGEFNFEYNNDKLANTYDNSLLI